MPDAVPPIASENHTRQQKEEAARTAEEAADRREKERGVVALERIADALHDSAYLAGLKHGWNLGLANDEAGYQAVIRREGEGLDPKSHGWLRWHLCSIHGATVGDEELGCPHCRASLKPERQ